MRIVWDEPKRRATGLAKPEDSDFGDALPLDFFETALIFTRDSAPARFHASRHALHGLPTNTVIFLPLGT